jgi:predicted AlkP superfamily pyrophosphatase or phosphodiesterase
MISVSEPEYREVKTTSVLSSIPASLNSTARRVISASIVRRLSTFSSATTRAFIKRNAEAGRSFYAYVSSSYFTAMEASLRAPFIIRWPGKIPAGRVSNEIVHIVDMYPTLARVGGAEVPKDRPIDGVDQLDFFLGKQENSNREGFPAYVANRLSAVK